MYATLADAVAAAPDDWVLHRGTFGDHVDELREWVGSDPTLWFLDPFGIKGLHASWYADLLGGPKNEIFVLAAHVGSVRLTGVVQSETDDIERRIGAIAAAPSLFAGEDAIRQAQLAQARADIRRQLDINDPAARTILVDALGSPDCIEELAAVAIERRPEMYLQLFCNALRRAGATVQLTIPIRDVGGRPMHVLIHASKHVAAMTAMKRSVTEGLARQDLDATMRELLKLELQAPVSPLIEMLCRTRAGQTIDWSSRKRTRRPLVVQIMEDTAAFGFQMPELKRELRARGLMDRDGRIEVVRFPELPA